MLQGRSAVERMARLGAVVWRSSGDVPPFALHNVTRAEDRRADQYLSHRHSLTHDLRTVRCWEAGIITGTAGVRRGLGCGGPSEVQRKVTLHALARNQYLKAAAPGDTPFHTEHLRFVCVLEPSPLTGYVTVSMAV